MCWRIENGKGMCKKLIRDRRVEGRGFIGVRNLSYRGKRR